ncbi:MAG TPA: argininosuccinate lyase [Xanthomonadales bacterium]|nr:argininosuccinate lyase [Xanthomonadales bacterium]
MEFMTGEDVILDRVLFPHDLRATVAHVRGLQRIGILTREDSERLCSLLDELRGDFFAGRFILDRRFEDGHSAIEAYLHDKSGDLGDRVHTGRSRNDQVAVATRLFMRERVQEIATLSGAIAQACLEQARVHADWPMPGYTHLQRAVPSSIGLWLGSFAEAFCDDVAFACSVLEILDASPLGTAAGYGVNLPLDRAGVATELGFTRLQINPMAVQNARGKFELMSLQAALHPMQDLRRLAWDLSLFATAEFAFVRLPPQYITGSSIMPNKANPDVVELLRARTASIEGALVEVQSILSLPSGYHRDLQLSKAPLVRGLQFARQALAIVPELIRSLAFDPERMRNAITPDMFATDIALERAAAGAPFREAYHQAKNELANLPPRDAEHSLAQRVSPGACGDLQLEQIGARLESMISCIPETSGEGG